MPRITPAAKEYRRQAILQAALSCLAQHGYAETSMSQIADAVGLTKGGLYAYFPSKEAILLAIAERYMDRQLAAFEPLPGETLWQTLDRALLHFEQTADPAAQRAIMDLWSNALHMPTVREALDQRHQRYLGTIAGLIKMGQHTGAFRADVDAEHLAGLFLAARDGMVWQAVSLGLPVPVAELSKLLRKVVARQLFTPPSL